MKITLITLLLFYFISINANIIYSDFKDKKSIADSENLLILGYDMAVMKILDPVKVKNSAVEGFILKEKYCPDWPYWLFSNYPAHKIAKHLGFEKYKYDTTILENKYKLINHENFITESYRLLSSSEIDSIVKTYDFKYTNGIGVVTIIEGMEKIEERVIGCVVFFDLDTREVYGFVRASGHVGGWGIKAYYGEGMIDLFKQAINYSYKQWSK